MIARALIMSAALSLALPSFAQHAQPYAGQQVRDIKALSSDEVKQYLAGAGLGYAKAAELNRYPGPMHALELADQLQLTAEQRAKTTALMQEHKTEARELGQKLVHAEHALDALFKSGNVGESELAAHVRTVATAQGEYRLSHLETHRKMRALLSAEQVARYDTLRGYGKSGAEGRHTGKH